MPRFQSTPKRAAKPAAKRATKPAVKKLEHAVAPTPAAAFTPPVRAPRPVVEPVVELLTYEQILVTLNISRAKWNTMLREGKGPAVVVLGPSLKRVRRIDFDRWLESMRREVVTFTKAEILESMRGAAGVEALDAAADLIKTLPDEQDRSDLMQEYEDLRRMRADAA